jgi:hypothetical protein
LADSGFLSDSPTIRSPDTNFSATGHTVINRDGSRDFAVTWRGDGRRVVLEGQLVQSSSVPLPLLTTSPLYQDAADASDRTYLVQWVKQGKSR